MTFITHITKAKYFTVSASILICSLVILNFGFANEPSIYQAKEGDSVKAMKRMYFSVTNFSFKKINIPDGKQHVENTGNNFNLIMENNLAMIK